MRDMRQRSTGLVLVLLGAALFGTLGVFGRAATLSGMSMATLLGLRFVAATGILLGYLLVRNRFRVLGGRLLGAELGLGVVYGVMSVTYFESLAWLSAGVAALLLFTYPVQVTLLSSVTLDERVTLPKLLSLAAAVSGVALVVTGGELAATPAGVVLVGVASVCYTIYAMGTRVLVSDVEPLIHASYVFAGVTVTVLAYGVATASLSVPATATGWWLVGGVTAVGTLVPMVLFTEGLARIEASTASIVGTSEPLTTVLLGVAFLGESLTPSIAVGALLVLSGVVLTSPAAERVIRRRLQRRGENPVLGGSRE
ncbi:MAG: EamA family transporter [Haloferacaceae archaeon]